MRTGEKRNLKLLTRVFLPYGLAVFILAVVVGAFLAYQNIKRAEADNRALLETALRATASQLDTMFAELDAMTYDLLDNRALYPYAAFQSGYSAMLAKDALKTYRASNSYLDDIVLYYGEEIAFRYHDDVRFFTSTGSFDSKTFWQNIHPLSGIDHEAFSEFATALTAPSVRFPVHEEGRTEKKDYLVYLVPASRLSFGVNGRGMIAYFISRKKLDGALAPAALCHGGSLIVHDERGRVIYAAGDAQAGNELFAPGPASGQTLFSSLLDGRVLVSYLSPERSFTYAMVLPSAALPSPFHTALSALLPLLALLLLAAAAAAYALFCVVYRPVAHLAYILKGDTSRYITSLDGIVTSLEDLKSRKDSLELRSKKQLELISGQYLHMLLQRGASAGEELLARLRELDISLTAPYYTVFIVRISAEDNILALREAALDALNHTDKTIRAIALEEPELLAALCGLTDAESAHSAAQRQLERLNMLPELELAELSMGLGGPVQGAAGAHAAFEEAQEALSEIFLCGRGVLLTKKKAEMPNESEGWYPLDEESALQSALLKGEESGARRIAVCMEEMIRHSRLPARVARAICQSILRHLATVLSAVHQEAPLRAAERTLNQPQATMAEFFSALDAACVKVCAASCLTREETNGRRLSRRIERYLTENYAQADLSLPLIAEAFSLSEGHLSRIFKEQTGLSVIQYLSSLRLSRAQTLLRDTALPLDDILAQCGYHDKSNFIRLFKRACFITPMQYRKISRGSEAEGLSR